jgi:hypothetical protein
MRFFVYHVNYAVFIYINIVHVIVLLHVKHKYAGGVASMINVKQVFSNFPRFFQKMCGTA